ncbi:MAG: acetyl-CoA carboxylase biotin carboxyl carrier protein subunit [Anaerolineae bacterium]|nr:acetyl-CoA carboxylase biotin carboxyl carrier protein subunit [Anaerolineae bacterium]
MKSLSLTINGHSYTVEVSNLNSTPLEVTVNGQNYEVYLDEKNAVSSTPFNPPVLSESKPFPATTLPAAPVNAVNDKNLRAPMPGLILDVSVKPGDVVIRGQQLLSLEAMKMKNAIRSPRDGVIGSVLVNNGQKVSHNDILISFE